MSFLKATMLVWAIFLDFIGILLFIFDFAILGIILSFLVDFLGILTIGAWAWFKGRELKEVPTRFFKKISSKFGLATASELIPFWGDIFPTWTIFVATTKD